MTRIYPIAAALLFTAEAQAATVLSNLSDTTPGSEAPFTSSSGISASQSKAATFTVGETIRLGSVYLALSNFDKDDIFSIFIGSLSGSAITPLAQLGLKKPVRSDDNTSQIWQFDPSATDAFLLTPGITYALTLKGGGTTTYTWGRVGPTLIPSGLATFGNYYFSEDYGVSYALSKDPNLTNSCNYSGPLVKQASNHVTLHHA